MALSSTPFDVPVPESLATVAADAKGHTPLVNETMRQERLLSSLTEATYVLREKLGPLLGAVSVDPSEKTATTDSAGSSEFIRVLSDNNDRLEIVIENINATRLALEI